MVVSLSKLYPRIIFFLLSESSCISTIRYSGGTKTYTYSNFIEITLININMLKSPYLYWYHCRKTNPYGTTEDTLPEENLTLDQRRPYCTLHLWNWKQTDNCINRLKFHKVSNTGQSRLSPIYIEELSFRTWSSTYVVPSVNSGLPPPPSRICAMTNSITGPKVDALLLRQLSPLGGTENKRISCTKS